MCLTMREYGRHLYHLKWGWIPFVTPAQAFIGWTVMFFLVRCKLPFSCRCPCSAIPWRVRYCMPITCFSKPSLLVCWSLFCCALNWRRSFLNNPFQLSFLMKMRAFVNFETSYSFLPILKSSISECIFSTFTVAKQYSWFLAYLQ